jgi:cell division protein FtsI/penicillin-binding protein 2
MDIKGLEVVESYERVYPYGRLAEDVLGYVSDDNRGAHGVEFFYDNLLWRFTSKGKGQQGNLVLSLHSPAQFAAHKMLEKNLVDFQAKNASFMVMDMENGEIIAMANASDDKDQKVPYTSNPCISKPVDPTIILGLLHTLNEEAGGKEITLQDKTGCQKPADGFSVCGSLDLTHLKEMKLEPEMLKVLWDLGLGKETGIDLPGERSGSFVECFLNPWDSIRHNRINATPLQLLRAFSAMINRGKLTRPRVAMNGDYTGKMNFWHFVKAKDRSSVPPTEKMTLILRSKLAASSLSGLASAYQYTKDLSQLVFLGFGPSSNPRFAYVQIIDGAKARRPSALMGALKTAKNLVKNIHLPDENTGPGLNMARGKNPLSQKTLSRL